MNAQLEFQLTPQLRQLRLVGVAPGQRTGATVIVGERMYDMGSFTVNMVVGKCLKEVVVKGVGLTSSRLNLVNRAADAEYPLRYRYSRISRFSFVSKNSLISYSFS
jgi:hypothetical protein